MHKFVVLIAAALVITSTSASAETVKSAVDRSSCDETIFLDGASPNHQTQKGPIWVTSPGEVAKKICTVTNIGPKRDLIIASKLLSEGYPYPIRYDYIIGETRVYYGEKANSYSNILALDNPDVSCRVEDKFVFCKAWLFEGGSTVALGAKFEQSRAGATYRFRLELYEDHLGLQPYFELTSAKSPIVALVESANIGSKLTRTAGNPAVWTGEYASAGSIANWALEAPPSAKELQFAFPIVKEGKETYVAPITISAGTVAEARREIEYMAPVTWSVSWKANFNCNLECLLQLEFTKKVRSE